MAYSILVKNRFNWPALGIQPILVNNFPLAKIIYFNSIKPENDPGRKLQTKYTTKTHLNPIGTWPEELKPAKPDIRFLTLCMSPNNPILNEHE